MAGWAAARACLSAEVGFSLFLLKALQFAYRLWALGFLHFKQTSAKIVPALRVYNVKRHPSVILSLPCIKCEFGAFYYQRIFNKFQCNQKIYCLWGVYIRWVWIIRPTASVKYKASLLFLIAKYFQNGAQKLTLEEGNVTHLLKLPVHFGCAYCFSYLSLIYINIYLSTLLCKSSLCRLGPFLFY